MAQGLGNRYSNCYRNLVFRYYPRGISTNENDFVTLLDTMELSDSTTMSTETINGMGDLPLFVARGRQEHMGTLSVLGLTYNNMRYIARLRPTERFTDIRNPAQTLWICSRKAPAGNYTITEDASILMLQGVVFEGQETPRQSSSSGVITYTMRFKFTCPQLDLVDQCGDEDLSLIHISEPTRPY